jgi:Fe-Mn family superoxide dismutase
MFAHETYRPETFQLSGLRGISDETLAMHFKLYEGYVEQTNVLNEKIAEILGSGKIDQERERAAGGTRRSS